MSYITSSLSDMIINSLKNVYNEHINGQSEEKPGEVFGRFSLYLRLALFCMSPCQRLDCFVVRGTDRASAFFVVANSTDRLIQDGGDVGLGETGILAKLN